MKFCGIDQSYTETGVVVLNQEGKIIFEHKLKSGKMRGIERLDFFYTYFEQLVKHFSDAVFATEGYAYNAGVKDNTRRHTQAGELKCAVELAIYRYGAFCVSYAPNSHRAKTIRRVHGSKSDFVNLVNTIYGTNFTDKDHNLVDAFTIVQALYLDVTRMRDSYGTILHQKIVDKTPFKNWELKKVEKFEERYFGIIDSIG